MHLIVFYYFLHLANAFVNSIFILINSEKKQTIQFEVEYCWPINWVILVADVDCGVSKLRSGKIVNGVDAADGEFPW